MSTPPSSETVSPALTLGLEDRLEHWQEVYRDLHRHPEVAFAETRTAAVVAQTLRALTGWQVTEGIGGTGVAGVLENGEGPTILLRADMDALPVAEATGLSYASVEQGVMHACGHDVHTASLLGACAQLSANPQAWSGTVVAVFQPAEEVGSGARAMLDDGLLDLIPPPEVCLGQHVAPFPGGVVATRPGVLMAASDSLRLTLNGAGGHASSPERAVSPVVLAAAVIMRLQTYSAQQAPLSLAPVLTPGAVNAGQAANVIPDQAEVLMSLRTFTPESRAKTLAAVERIVRAEAEASEAPEPPTVEAFNPFPVTVNDEAAAERVMESLRGSGRTVFTLPAPMAGSEDFGEFGTRIGCPSVFWHFGGVPAQRFGTDGLTALAQGGGLPEGVYANHSPFFAPDPEVAVPAGIRQLLGVADSWIARR
ncbi:amidohydrolase [Nocardioides insulae]|uniref:amidohydrolase n=1 Tax=Nocardioides insulae TaxID=394734 RepID=UPI000685C0D8|nr:amidohydrolase [Nocardioides insulae]